MNEQRFWELIESAWQNLPLLNNLRKETLQTNDPTLFEGLSFGLDDDVVEVMGEMLHQLDKDELTAFNHIIEEKLFQIDREEIHAYTDGSDEGFLYCRGFMVGMGETYYNLIHTTPSKAMMDTEAESVCFIGYNVYKEKYRVEFLRNTIF